MKQSLARYLLLTGTTSRRDYLVSGLILFAIKYVADWVVATQWFDREWSPLRYLIWPNGDAVRIQNLPPDDRNFAIVLLLIALPFIYIGVTLTLRRLREAGLPLWLVLLFFVPLVNLVLILLLCIAPPRVVALPIARPVVEHRARVVHRRIAGESSVAAFWLACVLSVGITVGLVVLSANLLQSYGFGLFVLAPFGVSWLAAVLYGLPQRRTFGQCILIAMTSLGISAIVLMLCALEGAICIIMAAPIAAVLGFMGGAVGFVFQSRPWADDWVPIMIVGMCVALPALTAAEAANGLMPEIRELRTEVVIDAPPETVWRMVVEFPSLDEPRDLLFRSGIAYPQRAEIHGRGVGAVRHCVFSTGPFVEPITVWDEPRRLAFDVTEQPTPMEELSPFHIHPPHLDRFLVSHRGEFLLEALPDGRTRLIGTTWYTNRMWPADYWGLCSDAIIGRIHKRVLDHVRHHSELQQLSNARTP